ncbi:MAG: alkaline phosphatase D family protein [Fulvivirga sp.]|nr:alkaline phosphatase D family protein [Fulvivirga sp.]
MNYITWLLCIIFCFQFGCQSDQTNKQQTIIAFGSCSYENVEEQMWDDIIAQNPDLMVLLGDNIYGDTHDMQLLKQKYDMQKARPSYQRLVNATQVIGVWDDHDYGINDGGKYYNKKDSSKLLMLDFLDYSSDHPVRSHQGVYHSYDLKSAGHLVKIILLDTRYFRDTLMADTVTAARYLPNPEGDILGEAQWQWLEQELKSSEADLHIIGSSIQVVAKDHYFEKWANFPKARTRLLDMIKQIEPKNTLIISGDRHIAEIAKMEIPGLDYPLYDFTASGLTHTWNGAWEESNKYRVGELIVAKNYGKLTINWDRKTVRMDVKGSDNETYSSHSIDLSL